MLKISRPDGVLSFHHHHHHIFYFHLKKTNDSNKAPEQPIDMRMKKDNKAKV